MLSYAEFCDKFNIRLDAQQAQAVQCTDRAVLLLAVPGSGKTTTLITRVAYLVYCMGIAPENILTMTYTVAASAEMRARFSAAFGEEYAKRLEFRTINGVCESIINRYARQTRAQRFDLVSDNGAILAEVFRTVRGEYPEGGDIKELQKAITYIKNMRLPRGEIDELEAGGIAVAPVYDAYRETLRRRGLMDYDDQLVFARQILLKYPDILGALRERYKYICVDEAQDTSKIQHEIIRLLTGESGSIFMVGDEDQSIYGFRAAYPDALMRFEGDYGGARVLLLESNYRSTPEITEPADRFIARNAARHEKHIRAVRGHGAPIRAVALSERAAQYSYICAMMENDPQRETAVLYRNNDSAVALIDWLDRRGVPFRCRRGENSFFSNRTVNGVRDIMTLSLEPGNAEAFMRVYSKFSLPVRRETAELAVSLYGAGKAGSLIAALESASKEQPDWLRERLAELHDNFIALRTDTAREALDRIRYKMGYGGYVLKDSGDKERMYLLSILAAREKNTESFLQRLRELENISTENRTADSKLILSTIHSSKGLEYDRVIIIDALDGILPSVPCSGRLDDEQRKTLEEERRLFYVAATRAKNELILMTYPRQGTSTFIEQFFEKPKRSLGGLTRPNVTQKTLWAAKDYFPGTQVEHSVFGQGTITEVKGELATVIFRSGETKKLMLPICIGNGLLKLVKK